MNQVNRAEFTKVLTQTQLENALNVPRDALGYVFPYPQGAAHRMVFQAADANGVLWPFELSIRREGRYPKPTLLPQLWRRYAEAKGLVPNDRVIISVVRDQQNGRRFSVRAQRNIIRLMGFNFWVDIENLPLYGI